jgi:putative ABC transport system ATP-binding protein
MADTQPLIQAKALTRTYSLKNRPPIKALDNVDLEVATGEFIAVVGRSGSGKTTLLNLIGALDRPTSGQILFSGKDLSGFSNRELALFRREKIGFVFQTFNLLPTLTVKENIETALIKSKMPKTEINKKMVEMLAFFELSDKADRLPLELSVGQQQKAALARALIKDPTVILADEPTGEMDPIAGKEILEKLLELNKKAGVTVIVASHGTSLQKQADRTVFLNAGKIDASGSYETYL